MTDPIKKVRPSSSAKYPPGAGHGRRKNIKAPKAAKNADGKFDSLLNEQVKSLAMLGAPYAVIADFFGIKEDTLALWMRSKVGFRQAWLEGGTLADAKVAMSLFRRATGWEHEAVKIFCNKDGDTTVVPFIERYPGDVTAQLAWLKARSGQQWNAPDKKEITGADGGPIETEHTVQFYIPDNGRAEKRPVIDIEPS